MRRILKKDGFIGPWHGAILRGMLAAALCVLCLSGCVSVPTKEALPVYSIDGVNYVTLTTLCNVKGINWDYDTFSRTVTLFKNPHKINLMVGESLVLVNGSPRHLNHPLEIYQGGLAVPFEFKAQILDVLFRDYALSKPACAPIGIKKIVIDAGHGGRDPGTIGRSGLREKDVNLDIAKRLSLLFQSQGVKVAMTRSTDSFIPLPSRVDVANKSGADLFLSIHSNANRVRSLSGFEVYYVSPLVDDSQRALSAARDAKLGFDAKCFSYPSLNLKAAIWDMMYTRYRAESVGLGRNICRSVKNDLDARIIGIKGARYYVLKGVRMPAVLVEIGFLSNNDEERMLKNSFYRQKMAEGIFSGIKNYSQELALAQDTR